MISQEQIVRILRFRYATAALVLLATMALYGAATLSRPGDQAAARSGEQVPVTAAVVACPAPGDSRISLLTPLTAKGTGRADVTEIGEGKAVASPATPGTLWNHDAEDDDAPEAYRVTASGALAAGLHAERTTADTKGDDRGLAGTRCAEPGNDLWFLAPGPVAADALDLYLTNVDAQPATVDLAALSGEGPLDTVDGRGTPVDPYTTRVIRIGQDAEGLGEIVNTADVLALRVRATAGRVAAALRVREGDGKGLDWAPLAGAPTTSLIVPGVPGDPGGRKLLVAVPGQADARVTVQVITETGAFAPEGQDTLAAPAETVTPIELDRALSGKPAAVRLVADRPILAGFTAERGDDVAFGAATAPLGTDGGLVADNRFDSVLLLTAPGTAATVRLTPMSAKGAAAAPQDVKIEASRTVAVELKPPAGEDEGFGVLVVPHSDSGPVHGARVMSTGQSDRLFTVQPITPALAKITLPPVTDSQRALFDD
jgi:uncharacterized protein DUF5719